MSAGDSAAYVQNVIIVGSGQVARLLADKIEKHPEYGLRVVGFVDHDDRRFAERRRQLDLLGTTTDLPTSSASTGRTAS